MTADNLGQQAYDVVEELSVRVGPRPAGSEGELRALDYVADELEKTCHRVRRIPVKGIPGQFPRELLILVGMVFLVYSIYRLVESPSAMLTYLVAFFGVPRLISAGRKRASAAAERKSENVVGHLSATQETRSDLVLCAHLDSAKANRVPGELWPKINRFLMRAWMPFVFAMAGAAALRWLEMRFGLVFRFFWRPMRDIGLTFALFFLIFELFYMYISREDAYSPGANDNASGVGVVLALARHLHDAPPAHLDMHYVLFTAEELGLIGSERFVKATELPKESTYVINLDMVGAGKQLCYVRGSGLIPPRLTDRELNALFAEAYPAIKRHYYFMGNSDFASFAAKGYRAASLCTKGNSQAEMVYHTERDTLEHIDAESLQLTADTVRKVIRLLDEPIGG
jgi:hypothetical protein